MDSSLIVIVVLVAIIASPFVFAAAAYAAFAAAKKRMARESERARTALTVSLSEANARVKTLEAYLRQSNEGLAEANARAQELDLHLQKNGYMEEKEVREKIQALQYDARRLAVETLEATSQKNDILDDLRKASENAAREQKRLARLKALYQSVKNALDNWLAYEPGIASCRLPAVDIEEAESLAPSVTAMLHAMDMKDLRKAFRENERQMESLFTQYEGRYTTKANKSIYALVVIALRSELQAILANLKFDSLEKANENVKKVIEKAITIAGSGNQSILPTLTKFIGQIEYHFKEAVKIEYLWHVRKEQARQEQIAVREQMRQEAAERRALEEQAKKIVFEESKYQQEIAKLQDAMAAADAGSQAAIQARIQEVQAQLAEVVVKKEEIASLQKGKAGTVYIISNLGSFGDSVFKIGMTRRLNAQERVDELGDASVPFEFDVHGFIFSEDAVALESKLHGILNDNRMNKVNLRKEFFRTSVDALERIVQEIDPTADFTRTMAAEEYRASIGDLELGEPVQSADDPEPDQDE